MSFDALREAWTQTQLARDLLTSTCNRTIATIFDNPLKAEHGLKRCMRRHGITETLRIISEPDRILCVHHFGLRRDWLFARGADKEQVKEAIRELAEVLPQRDQLDKKLADLVRTYTQFQARIGAEKTREEDRMPDRSRGRQRQR